MSEQQITEVVAADAAGGASPAAEGTVQRKLQRAPRKVEQRLDVLGWEDLYVGMEVPDPIVVSRYNGAWTPKGYYNAWGGWSTNMGVPGHLYLNGEEHAGWDTEDTWVSLPAVPKTKLQQPGPDTYAPMSNPMRATFVSRPSFYTSARTVEASDSFQTWRSHLRGKPTGAITEEAFDNANLVPVMEQGGGAASRASTPVAVNITQAVATTVSDAATGTFGFTTTRGAEQSAEVGGEGSKKDVWKVSGKFGAKWSEVEAEQTQRALQSIYSEVSTSTQSFTVTFTAPAGVPCVVLIVPRTRKATSNIDVLNTDESGFAAGEASQKAVIESNVPKGYVAVFGYDTDYVTALGTHYEACRALRQECEALSGKPLEDKKSEMRKMITEFTSAHQPNVLKARVNAEQQLKALTPAGGGQGPAVPAAADNVSRWHLALEEIWRYAAGATPPPGAPPAK